MPSTPPPLPSSTKCLTPWGTSPSGRSLRKPNRISWSPVFVAVSLSFALVAGIVAWIAAHPRDGEKQSPVRSVATVEPTIELPSPLHSPVLSATPALHRPHSREAIGQSIPVVEDDPPPLPPPSSLLTHPDRREERSEVAPEPALPSAKKAPPRRAAGETYGTQVLFHTSQAEAAEVTQHDHKLLFVMHISGNFEDSCFT